MTAEYEEIVPRLSNGHAVPQNVIGLPAARAVGRHTAAPSRMGGLWVAAVTFALVLVLLLVFVLQNGQSAEVSFLGAHGNLPMGIVLLLAAIFGLLLVALPGTARITQLWIMERRRRPAAVEPTNGQRMLASGAPLSSTPWPSGPPSSSPEGTGKWLWSW